MKLTLFNRFLRSCKLKKAALGLADLFLVGIALTVSLHLRFDWNVPEIYMGLLKYLLLPAILIHLAVFSLAGLYRRLWGYASVNELILIAVIVSIGTTGTYFYSLIFDLLLPRGVYVIHFILLFLLLGGSRISLQILHSILQKVHKYANQKKVLIIGAGDAGVMVARELKKLQGRLGTWVVGFVDDDSNKHRQIIQGVPVLGGREEIPRLVKEKGIDEIVLAIPSAPYSTLRHFLNLCSSLNVQMKKVPGIFEILEGKVRITHLKEVDIEDLLGRRPVKIDMQTIASYLANKTVLVTGAGGSIGSELCRQIVLTGPKKLLMLDHSEDGLFHIYRELEAKDLKFELCHLIRDVRNRSALENVFSAFLPDVVFHAAAYKHVPFMEGNVEEAVYNNILGSKNMMDLAEEYSTDRFVFISTDKAVNPSSVMGATKRVSEIYMQHRARNNGSCKFCAVRFGNVLGSRGSVVTIFREQIAAGGPVTVTHPDMTRYFMTIPEAVQLVIQAGALGQSGEIFVLDMEEQVKIIDLARDMIRLSGLQPGQDIEISFTGIRPGEKLYEELFSDREKLLRSQHERIFIAPDFQENETEAQFEMQRLNKRLGMDLSELLSLQDRRTTEWLQEMGAS